MLLLVCVCVWHTSSMQLMLLLMAHVCVGFNKKTTRVVFPSDCALACNLTSFIR
jgi:hypothetical protein